MTLWCKDQFWVEKSFVQLLLDCGVGFHGQKLIPRQIFHFFKIIFWFLSGHFSKKISLELLTHYPVRIHLFFMGLVPTGLRAAKR